MLFGQLAVVLDLGGLEARRDLAVDPVCGIEAMADDRRFVGSENFGDLYQHGFVPRLRPAPAAPAPCELSLQAAVERLIEVK